MHYFYINKLPLKCGYYRVVTNIVCTVTGYFKLNNVNKAELSHGIGNIGVCLGSKMSGGRCKRKFID